MLAYLTFLGSRLVFLIDWSRARKRLRTFAPWRVCLEVLRWAADHDYGHRGFLSLGGEQLIFDALETAGRLPLRRGVGSPIHSARNGRPNSSSSPCRRPARDCGPASPSS